MTNLPIWLRSQNSRGTWSHTARRSVPTHPSSWILQTGPETLTVCSEARDQHRAKNTSVFKWLGRIYAVTHSGEALVRQILHFWILKSSPNCVKDDAFHVLFLFKKLQETMSMLQSRCNLHIPVVYLTELPTHTKSSRNDPLSCLLLTVPPPKQRIRLYDYIHGWFYSFVGTYVD